MFYKSIFCTIMATTIGLMASEESSKPMAKEPFASLQRISFQLNDNRLAIITCHVLNPQDQRNLTVSQNQNGDVIASNNAKTVVLHKQLRWQLQQPPVSIKHLDDNTTRFSFNFMQVVHATDCLNHGPHAQQQRPCNGKFPNRPNTAGTKPKPKRSYCKVWYLEGVQRVNERTTREARLD